MNKLSPAGQPSKDNHQPYQYEYEHPFDNDRLPNFIIVGVMKGGTSAAAFNLNLHPDVFCVTETSKFETMNFHKHNLENSIGGFNAWHKELDFFNYKENFNYGIDVYKTFFQSNCTAVGESSPNYFHFNNKQSRGCLPRMMKTIPNAKIIILLRDPITRAFSHWNMIQKTKPEWGKTHIGKSFYECTVGNPKHNPFLHRSKYFSNLIQFRGVFKHVYVGLQESLMLDPETEYNKIFKFLGVRSGNLNLPYQNVHCQDYDSSLDLKSINYLKKYFKNDVDNVKSLLPNLNYSLWNEY